MPLNGTGRLQAFRLTTFRLTTLRATAFLLTNLPFPAAFLTAFLPVADLDPGLAFALRVLDLRFDVLFFPIPLCQIGVGGKASLIGFGVGIDGTGGSATAAGSCGAETAGTGGSNSWREGATGALGGAWKIG